MFEIGHFREALSALRKSKPSKRDGKEGSDGDAEPAPNGSHLSPEDRERLEKLANELGERS